MEPCRYLLLLGGCVAAGRTKLHKHMQVQLCSPTAGRVEHAAAKISWAGVNGAKGDAKLFKPDLQATDSHIYRAAAVLSRG